MRQTLLQSLYASLPIFAGGVLNTIAVAALVAVRMESTAAFVWLGLEVVLAAVRLPVLVAGRKAVTDGRRGPTDIYISLAVLWAASVGYGTFMCVMSGDWVAATLACLSAAGMVGGICFRNFGAPRLVAVMIGLALGPCAIAGVFSGQPILLLIAFQIPFYLFSMSAAAFHLNRLLLRTMRAELINDHHARHDLLTGLLNRAGLTRWAESRAGASERSLAVFYIDLDRFKNVNDTFGHKAGDEILKAVGDRLRSLGTDWTRIARFGGDEFVLAVEGMSADAACRFGERIAAGIGCDPYMIDGQMVHIGASVGVAVSPDHGSTLAALLEAADVALYSSKDSDRSATTLAFSKNDRHMLPRAPRREQQSMAA